MKHTFKNSFDCIHEYAQQTNTHGKCSNVFFENTKIYSYGYHYLLGEFINPFTIVINDKGYSNTTRKHISKLISATRQYKQYFTTDIDLNMVYNEINSLVARLPKARKKDEISMAIINKFEKLNVFFIEFNKVNERFDAKYKSLEAIYINLLERKNEFVANLKEIELAKAQKIKAEYISDVAKFRSYEIASIYNRANSLDVLRLSKCGQYVETSQQVKIPIISAKMLYNAIINNINIVGYKIEQYRVNKIVGNKVFIGCHIFDKKELVEMGAKL